MIKIYKKKIMFYFFGRLSEEKGLKVFLEVCKELPNINFKIAGTGPLEEECQKIKNIDYVGFKTGKDLEQLISKAQFSVYPSIWYENCPLSILESQSMGTPVITANYGGMQELVEKGKTGILINKVDKDNLKKAILELYNNKNEIKKMSEQCIKKRNNMISIEQYCDKIMKIYKKVLKEG